MSTEIEKTKNQVTKTETPSSTVSYKQPKYRSNKSQDGYELFVELPGYGKEEVTLELVENHLQIRTSAVKDDNKSDQKVLLQEWNKRPYKLELALPDDVDQNNISAKLENGLLQVSLPKKESLKPRQLTIQ